MNCIVSIVSPAGMIDWITLILEGLHMDSEMHRYATSLSDRIERISTKTGERMWSSPVHENIRSDTHQITVKFGSRIEICGSPARVHHCNNVFGSLDIQFCALSMINFVCLHNPELDLPRNLKLWKVSKIDVTRNYDFGSEAQCQQVTDYFKAMDYGRLKKVTYDTSVVFGHKSTWHRLKIYMKGIQCLKLIREKSAHFTPDEIAKAKKLVRLEYSICRALIAELLEAGLRWYELTPDMLLEMHTQAFDPLISDLMVTDMDNILDKLMANVGAAENQIPTQGQAVAAYDFYLRCRTIGFQQCRESYTRPTFARHLKNLGTIGIKAIDLQPSNVIPFRRKPILLGAAVSSWDEIKLP